MSQEWASCFLEGPYWKRGQVLLLRLHFFKKKATPSYCISVACLQRRLFSQIHESWEEAMASTACPFRTGGKKDVFSTLASLFAFSRASFSNSAWGNNEDVLPILCLSCQLLAPLRFSCASAVLDFLQPQFLFLLRLWAPSPFVRVTVAPGGVGLSAP